MGQKLARAAIERVAPLFQNRGRLVERRLQYAAHRAVDLARGVLAVLTCPGHRAGHLEKCRALGFVGNVAELRVHAVAHDHAARNVRYLGKVVGSMDLGRVFRKIGALTIVARAVDGSDGVAHIAQGRCFSACVYALMGGRKRIVPDRSLVGIHRMFALEGAVDPAGGRVIERRFDDGNMRNVLARYSSEMGVSRELINKAEQTSTDTIHVVSPQELTRWRLGSSRF